MPILNSLISLLNTKRMSKIEQFKKQPGEVQESLLFGLLRKAKNTEWGKRYQFSDIRTIAQFRERIPVQTYESLEGEIDRLRKGEHNILWPSEIKWFAQSSGTTNNVSKYIPVSKEALEDCHFRGGKDLIHLYTKEVPETGVFKGKGLTLGGTHHNKSGTTSFYGDLSAILIENAPFWAQMIRTPNQEVALLEDWEEKLARITEIALKENVTSFLGVPSWNLVLIQNIIKTAGAKNLLEIWPNIEVFIHGGVSFTPYREQFKALIPSENMHYMETYNASEGFFAMQDDLTDPGMLLMMDYGIFFEFMPLEELGKEFPKTLTVDEVETGTNYALIITTNAGLWRYMIGDTVKFTSLYPHKIIISGRTKLFINAFGEEVIVDNAEKALATACEQTQAIVREYTAAPVYMSEDEQGTHEWMIEFDKKPHDFEAFCTLLDRSLQEVNSDYAAKRYKDITLQFPKIHQARAGLFYDWMKSRGKLGGQNKVPRLSNSREYIEPLLELNNHKESSSQTED